MGYRMEHRWGKRFAVHRSIWITASRPRIASIGRLMNLSLSGAFIADLDLRLFSLIYVVLESPPRPKHDGDVICAHVTRVCSDGIGVEWCEFGPPAVAKLLRDKINSSRAIKGCADADEPGLPPLVGLLMHGS
jgi:hypothetical protein